MADQSTYVTNEKENLRWRPPWIYNWIVAFVLLILWLITITIDKPLQIKEKESEPVYRYRYRFGVLPYKVLGGTE